MATFDILPLSPDLHPPDGPYSHALRRGVFIVTSSYTGTLPDGTLNAADFETECQQAIENINLVLQSSGCNWLSVLRVNVALTELNQFDTFNQLLQSYLTKLAEQAHKKTQPPYPTCSVIGAAALLGGARLSLDVWAVREW